MLRPQDVGHRIVIRRVVGVRHGRALFSDALGELTELTGTHLTLATADGPLRVPLSELHRAKRVPAARPPGRAATAELERAAAEAWPAPVQERLGDWLLRAADGWTGRANSALAVGDPGLPIAAAIDAVESWYDRRGLPALVATPLPLAAAVAAELDRRGWGARPPVLVQTASLATLRTTRPDHTAPPHDTAQADGRVRPAVELATGPAEDWLDIVAGRKGGLPPAARHVLTAVDRVCFAAVRPAGPANPDG
ncbi:GNAT family N-acetyltransferase, partial [Plantactinospora siamensis]